MVQRKVKEMDQEQLKKDNFVVRKSWRCRNSFGTYNSPFSNAEILSCLTSVS